MKILIALAFCFAITLLYSQCKSNEVLNPQSFKKQKIYFGAGGGFAGTITEYCLLENGQLFGRPSQTAEWQSMDTLNKRQTNQYFSQINNLNLLDIDFDRAGNWSYFVTIESEGNVHKIQWCAEAQPPTTEIISFYNILNENVKSLPPFRTNDPVR